MAALVGVVACMVLATAPAWTDSAQDNYSAYCARCHGEDGHGDGPSVASLNTIPQSFGNCAQMRKLSEETMFKAIKRGGAAVGLPGDMPNWNVDLSDDEIHDLVTFVRTFCKKK
ncbi:MAG TPA: cytochrome c [Candidatus Binataceae bacterium]|nr:cytochrome c [Candidatus Binataceae bacterium]